MENEMLKNLLGRIPRKISGRGMLVFLGIGGMLLILLSEFLPADSTRIKPADDTASYDTYKTQMEERLESLIGQMDGAGKTQVMVTLETTAQNIYAVNTKEGENTREQEHVLLNGGEALTQTVESPEIRGVAVVCEGGDQIHVAAQITEMLSSLLGISSSHISVTKMN